jgi:hypothetical protein
MSRRKSGSNIPFKRWHPMPWGLFNSAMFELLGPGERTVMVQLLARANERLGQRYVGEWFTAPGWYFSAADNTIKKTMDKLERWKVIERKHGLGTAEPNQYKILREGLLDPALTQEEKSRAGRKQAERKKKNERDLQRLALVREKHRSGIKP